MKKTFFLNILLFATASIFAQESKYEQGVAAYNQRNLQAAYQLMSEELAVHPKHAEAYSYRALIALDRDKATDALRDAQLAVKYVSSKNKQAVAWVHSVRAMALMYKQEFALALADLNVSVKMDTSVTNYRAIRGACYEGLKQYAETETDYRTILLSEPSNENIRVRLVNLYMYLQKTQAANECMEQWVKISPKTPAAYYCKAELEFKLQQYDAAIADMLQAFVLDEAKNEVYDLFLEYATKNYRLSVEKLDELIKQFPYYDRWYLVRANLLEGKGDYALAIGDYTRYAELADSRNKAIILPNRANCYTETGNYLRAIADFDESLKTDSANAYTYAYRGDTRRLMGEFNLAVQDFSKAIQLDSTQTWFYYRRGWVHDEFLKNTQAALSDYNRGIAIDKNYAYTYLHRGRLYEKELKDTVKAKADYEMILKLDTAINKSGNCRQYAYFQLGQMDKAIDWLDKIIERYPTAGNYYDAACLYARMHKVAESISSLRHAFEQGYSEFVHLSKDDDLNSVRNLPEFKALIQEWKARKQKLNTIKDNSPIVTPKTTIE